MSQKIQELRKAKEEEDEAKEDMKELLLGEDLPDEDDEWEPVNKRIKKQSDDDEVVEINIPKKKNKSKKKGAQIKNELTATNQSSAKRVRFDLSKNKVTEFFKHGKVAQRTLKI